MKGLTISIIIIAILIFLLPSNSHTNPYSGKYSCLTNTAITLELKENNKFALISRLDKNEECIYGDYSVKDNNIVLIFNNDYSHLYDTRNINGKVEGARISFSHFSNKDNLLFNKL